MRLSSRRAMAQKQRVRQKEVEVEEIGAEVEEIAVADTTADVTTTEHADVSYMRIGELEVYSFYKNHINFHFSNMELMPRILRNFVKLDFVLLNRSLMLLEKNYSISEESVTRRWIS